MDNKNGKITFNVDSGAMTTMITEHEAPDYPRVHDRFTGKMIAANETTISTFGCKDLAVGLGKGKVKVMQASVGRIKRNLLSVASLVACGCTVIFDKKPRIIDSSGVVVPMYQRKTMYDVDLELVPFAQSPTVKARSRG